MAFISQFSIKSKYAIVLGMTSSIKLTIENDIATLTLNRPEVHNAFHAEMIAELSQTFDGIAQRPDIKVIVIKGEGKSFSAGADLNWMKDSIEFSKEDNRRDAIALAEMLNKLNTLPQLAVACVHGAAMGGGFGIVSCCDYVIANDKAIFSLSEVKLGLIPATISPYVIQAIGQRQARRFFQTGERFGANKAKEIGLVHEVGDIEQLLESVLNTIASNGPAAMRMSKKLCFDLSGSYVSEGVMNETANRIAEIRTTQEAQERLAKFLNK